MLTSTIVWVQLSDISGPKGTVHLPMVLNVIYGVNLKETPGTLTVCICSLTIKRHLELKQYHYSISI